MAVPARSSPVRPVARRTWRHNSRRVMQPRSETPRLDVAGIRILRERSSKGLRFDLGAPDVEAQSLIRGEVRGDQLVARALREGPPRDLVGTYWANIYVISIAFRDWLESSQLTGWLALPITVEGSAPRPTYHLLAASGRCGPVTGSGRAVGPDMVAPGAFLEPSTWDGADFFVPENLVGIHLTSACADRLEMSGLSNVATESAGIEAAAPT
jgi:hypothetical protein